MISLPFVKTHFGPELGLFLVRSSFILAGSSNWQMRSGKVMYSLVALLVAVLLKCMKKVTMEPFRNWMNWQSIVARSGGWKEFKWLYQFGTDGTSTEENFAFKVTVYILQLFLIKLVDIVHLSFFEYTNFWKCGFLLIRTYNDYIHTTFEIINRQLNRR